MNPEEQLYQTPQQPRAEDREMRTPERLFWERLEPSYMKEEVPDHDQLEADDAVLEEDARAAMDKVAAFIMSENEHIEVENSGRSFFSIVEKAYGEGAITLEDKQCIEGWFKPTNRRKFLH